MAIWLSTMKKKFSIADSKWLFFVLLISIFCYRNLHSYSKLSALRGIHPDDITIFRIYPGVMIPVGKAIEFNPHDTMVTDFFQSLSNINPYWLRGRDNHSIWFLEVATKDVMIQISFYIPGKNKILAGTLGKWGKNNSCAVFYGDFQSHQLYQWYQTYSHRWLTPEGTPPAPQP